MLRENSVALTIHLGLFENMANTYSQIYLQVVFAVQARQCLILRQNKEELHKYITGIVARACCESPGARTFLSAAAFEISGARLFF